MSLKSLFLQERKETTKVKIIWLCRPFMSLVITRKTITRLYSCLQWLKVVFWVSERAWTLINFFIETRFMCSQRYGKTSCTGSTLKSCFMISVFNHFAIFIISFIIIIKQSFIVNNHDEKVLYDKVRFFKKDD